MVRSARGNSASIPVLAAIAGCALIACGESPPAPVPPPDTTAMTPTDLASVHADAAGIAWYDGDVDAAFQSAAAANKPVLLYWGAQWCPPCKQLKSSVFNRPDFIEKSKLFVAVYLDGDLPDAQKWGDVFRVTGYPTVVVLKPDRTEVTRVAGNMDLSLYATVLDDALGDVRPVREVVELAAKGETPLGANDCRRLAYHAFGLEDEGVFDPARLQPAFENAARLCPAELVKERARLPMLAAAQATARQKETIEKGGKADKSLTVLLLRVHDLLADREVALSNVDAIRGLQPEFYLAARQTVPRIAASLRERVMTIADAASSSPNLAPADRLAPQVMKIRVAKAYARDGKVPTDVRSVALATVTKLLDVKQEPYVRAGVVNSAINVYIALDDWERARDLLSIEATTSNTPHYYIGDLADAEEHLGNTGRALELYAEAYEKAKGPASRFQWGYSWLDSLLRLAPDDTAAIEKAGLAVMSELDGPNRIHRRTLSRLGRLDKSLRAWNTTPARAAVVAKLKARVAQVCEKSFANPADDAAGAAHCRDFGTAVAAG